MSKSTKKKIKKNTDQARHPPSHAGRLACQKNNNEREKERIPTKHNRVTLEAAAEVGGTSSLDRFYVLVGLAPCYPVYCLLPAFVDRGFLTIVAPSLPMYSFGHHPQLMRGVLY